MKDWKLKEWIECGCWAVGIILIILHHSIHYPEWVHACYTGPHSAGFCHYLLPSAYHEGLAGFSFISVTTGLNLALVKFEVFVKTLKDIEEQWDDEIAAQMRTFPAANVDDTTKKSIDDYVLFTVQKEKEKAYAEHKRLGLRWRWLAIRMNVLGLSLLFFQYSAGLIGLLFVLPVLGAVQAKRKCKDRLNEALATLRNFSESVHQSQVQRHNQVVKTIGNAAQG